MSPWDYQEQKMNMKKVLFAIMISAAAISCTKETVTTANQVAITFDETFIDIQDPSTKVTDPSITTGSIDAFKVWGFMDTTTGVVFDDVLVTKENDKWSYGELQYWTPEHKYYFRALAPVENCNWTLDDANANEFGLGKVAFTNIDGTEDLLYTTANVTTPDKEILLSVGMPVVKLTFSHLLSKVRFTFINGFSTSNVTMKISEIQMTAPKAASIDLAVENWWDNDDWKLSGTETATLSFEDVPMLEATKSGVSANERLTIPADATYEYSVSFKVNLFVGDQPAMEVVKTAKLTGAAFNMGKSYNIKTEVNPQNLGLDPIEFEVEEVKTWVPAGDFTASVNE